VSQKKKNPKNFPATVDEVEQQYNAGVSAGTNDGLMRYMTVLRDKTGYGWKRLKRVWDCASRLCELVGAGLVDVPSLAQRLDKIMAEPLCPLMHSHDKPFTPPDPPVTQADVKRSYRRGMEEGREFATMVFLLAANKCEGYKRFKLRAIHHEAMELRKSIELGYVKTSDLQQVLEDEVRIRFE